MNTKPSPRGDSRTTPTAPVASPNAKAKLVAAPPQLRIVGIGCSAGGLEACEQFFKSLPADSGMAFVVVSHLDPAHKGIMPELLQRYTAMEVKPAEDGMRVKSNHVYVIPSNVDLSILHGRLQILEPTAPRGLRLPVDFFFKHLALDQKDRAVGIILSGMGTDGSQGVRAIKEQMGLVLVQEPSSAKYDGMPRGAINSALADIVAPAEELPTRLITMIKHPVVLPRPAQAKEEKATSALQKIFVLLRAKTGADFSGYKPATIYRRIERRMSVHQLQPLASYVRYLQETPREVDFLFRELLIGVTSFFRDAAAFDILKDEALPRILKNKAAGDTLRVWTPGCSSGEEACSIAMVLAEALARNKKPGALNFQMFATDLDKEAIDKARAGAFPSNIATEVSPERLERFFSRSETGFTIKNDIRERIVFAPQNVISDPPFTKLDLVVCRNLLIYLNVEWQKKLLVLFHYVLNPGGVLFLGSAETIDGFTDLFQPINSRWRIFQRKESPASFQAIAAMAGSPTRREKTPPVPAISARAATQQPDLAETAQRILLDSYVPPAVVINPDGDIFYVVGRTGKYLEPASGKVNLNIYGMAREGLRDELLTAVRSAVHRQSVVTVENLRVRTNGSFQLIRLTVKPLNATRSGQDLLLVVFEDAEPEPGGVRQRRFPVRAGATSRELEKELHRTKSQLQAVHEQAAATEEELKAANEEMQSNNEELQSTNEELTTSKEELQSLNEEMSTVNAELQSKLDELAHVNNDMRNLLNGVDVATVFTDNELRIKRYTQQATRIINLIPGDVGRPLRDLVTTLKYDRLVEDARSVLATLVFKETQVETNDNRWHLMRILPYRTTENVIDGVVITFTDITALKQMEATLRESQSGSEEARLMAESILDAVREPLLVLDAELRIVSANRAFCETFHIKPEQAVQHLLYEAGHRQWDIPELRRQLLEVLRRQTDLRDFNVERDFPGIGHRVLLLNARNVKRAAPRPPLILLAIEDITKA